MSLDRDSKIWEQVGSCHLGGVPEPRERDEAEWEETRLQGLCVMGKTCTLLYRKGKQKNNRNFKKGRKEEKSPECFNLSVFL